MFILVRKLFNKTKKDTDKCHVLRKCISTMFNKHQIICGKTKKLKKKKKRFCYKNSNKSKIKAKNEELPLK